MWPGWRKIGNQASWRGTAAALVFLALLHGLTMWKVSPKNFTGVDEWLYLSLGSKMLFGFPHSNRPFTLLWSLPAVWLFPNSFLGYHVLHIAYLFGSGVLVFWLCRRLAPTQPLFALLSAAFTLTWVPRDMARLATVQACMNSSVLCIALLAIVALVESWIRRRVALLALAALLAFMSARSYEAVLALLSGAPLLLFWMGPVERKRLWRWVLGWEAAVAIAGLCAVWPLIHKGAAASYQLGVLGMDLNVRRYALRLGWQYAEHLVPLVAFHWRDLAYVWVWVVAGVFACGLLLGSRHEPAGGDRETSRQLAGLGLLGLVLAGLGYAVIIASASVRNATRTQILSAPGVAMFLASLLLLVRRTMPRRWRQIPLLVGGLCVVALGTANTLAMQRVWDRTSYYSAQMACLRQMTAIAPDLAPNTLVLLIDQPRAWPYSLAFRHAVDYLYRGHCTAHVLGAEPLLYDLASSGGRLESLPWPMVRRAWGEQASRHEVSETVVFRFDLKGRLTLLDQWPPPLASFVADPKAYAPARRIRSLGTPDPRRRILGSS